MQSSDRAENRLDPTGEVVSSEAEVSEHFEFSEGMKLQLAGECETSRTIVVTLPESAPLLPSQETLCQVEGQSLASNNATIAES